MEIILPVSMFMLFGYPLRQPSPTRGRAITNGWKISMARSTVGNRATSSSDQRPMYDQLLRPKNDSTINRRVRRPIVRSIVASCYRAYDQSGHPTTDGTINRKINRIVALNDRSYGQS